MDPVCLWDAYNSRLGDFHAADNTGQISSYEPITLPDAIATCLQGD